MKQLVKELCEHIGGREVSHIKLHFEKWREKPIKFSGTLKEFLNYSPLDIEYDNGFGIKELRGYIWYADGTWSERSEAYGAEWWEYRERPCPLDTILT